MRQLFDRLAVGEALCRVYRDGVYWSEVYRLDNLFIHRKEVVVLAYKPDSYTIKTQDGGTYIFDKSPQVGCPHCRRY